MAFDYKKIGFKCGIEIHQQLEGKKLFCSCPTEIRRENADFKIRRELKALAGETGVIDIAARHEQEKKKYFLYEGYDDTTCLVEIDEEPPHPVNQEALRVALQVASLLNAKVVDEVHFMRKIVVDGSNVSGFQRTGLIATDGYVEVKGRKIGIDTVCLEEEACQVIQRTKEYDAYNLSRLGIPLIEIATAPDIASPEECREVAGKIGMILRSVEGMKRGIGSIRQDVNVSIRGGSRVEIKGFQDYKNIPKALDNEILRQLELEKDGKKMEPHVRKVEPDLSTSFLRPMPGAARMYPETDIPPSMVDSSGIGGVELIEEKEEKLKQAGIGDDLAKATAKAGKADVVLEFMNKFRNVKGAFIAETMISTPKMIKRKDNVETNLDDEGFGKIFNELDAGRIAKDSVYNILLDHGKSKRLDFSRYDLMGDKELEREIKKAIAENKGVPFNALIGKVMAKLRGKADGKKINDMLKKLSE